jgi:hypothetical protein
MAHFLSFGFFQAVQKCLDARRGITSRSQEAMKSGISEWMDDFSLVRSSSLLIFQSSHA